MVPGKRDIGKLSGTIRSAVSRNCGTLISFRIGVQEAKIREEAIGKFQAKDFDEPKKVSRLPKAHDRRLSQAGFFQTGLYSATLY